MAVIYPLIDLLCTSYTLRDLNGEIRQMDTLYFKKICRKYRENVAIEFI